MDDGEHGLGTGNQAPRPIYGQIGRHTILLGRLSANRSWARITSALSRFALRRCRAPSRAGRLASGSGVSARQDNWADNGPRARAHNGCSSQHNALPTSKSCPQWRPGHWATPTLLARAAGQAPQRGRFDLPCWATVDRDRTLRCVRRKALPCLSSMRSSHPEAPPAPPLPRLPLSPLRFFSSCSFECIRRTDKLCGSPVGRVVACS